MIVLFFRKVTRSARIVRITDESVKLLRRIDLRTLTLFLNVIELLQNKLAQFLFRNGGAYGDIIAGMLWFKSTVMCRKPAADRKDISLPCKVNGKS